MLIDEANETIGPFSGDEDTGGRVFLGEAVLEAAKQKQGVHAGIPLMMITGKDVGLLCFGHAQGLARGWLAVSQPVLVVVLANVARFIIHIKGLQENAVLRGQLLFELG